MKRSGDDATRSLSAATAGVANETKTRKAIINTVFLIGDVPKSSVRNYPFALYSPSMYRSAACTSVTESSARTIQDGSCKLALRIWNSFLRPVRFCGQFLRPSVLQQVLQALDHLTGLSHHFLGQALQLLAAYRFDLQLFLLASASRAGSFSALTKASRRIFIRSAGSPGRPGDGPGTEASGVEKYSGQTARLASGVLY